MDLKPAVPRQDLSIQSPLLGAVLGDRYQIDRELGRGGMAIVYLARDLRQEREVAVKVLHPDLTAVLGAERFRREIHVSTSLSHPHILPVYDAGEIGAALYYVMPYVAGESLAAKLHREHQLSVADAIRITCEVAMALDYAHRRGIIHRDIKPENILLDAEGHAIVADFGIARAISASGEEKLTQTGITLGTPAYMSPEQAMAERDIDGRSDIYSLGCLLYEALAGHPPFVGPTAQAVIARQMAGVVPSLTVVRGTIPEEVEDVVMIALAKVPADRFGTAAEFAEALEAAGGTTGLARTTTRRSPMYATRQQRARRKTDTRRRWVIGAVVALVLASGLVAWRMRVRASLAALGALPGLPPQRIAILYFDDLSSGRTMAPLASGLTEELIAQLTHVGPLDVVSRNGVAQFRDVAVSPDSAARALGAGTIVRGSVEPVGDKVHVAVRLIDGNSGADFQRASFDAPLSDPIATRDSLVLQVARMVRSRLGEEVRLRDQRSGTSDAAAWALVQSAELRGRATDSAIAAGDTAAVLRDVAGADSLLTSAAAHDPQWPDVPVMRGTIAYRTSRFFGDDPLRASRWIDSGLVQAEQALRLAPQSADALELRGTLRYWKWLLSLEPAPARAKALLDSARADLESSTRLSPAQAGAWAVLSHLYYQVNDVVSAKLAARSAHDADAYLSNADVIVWRLFASSYDLAQFPEAARWCEEGASRFPSEARFTQCRLLLMETPSATPDVAHAWRLADSLVTLTPADSRDYAKLDARIMVAGALARAGLADSARRVLATVTDPPELDPTLDLTLSTGVVWNILGDKDRALDALSRYIAANPARASDLDDDNTWAWRNLRDDPRFQALAKRSPR